jgi:hypothetical protein
MSMLCMGEEEEENQLRCINRVIMYICTFTSRGGRLEEAILVNEFIIFNPVTRPLIGIM